MRKALLLYLLGREIVESQRERSSDQLLIVDTRLMSVIFAPG